MNDSNRQNIDIEDDEHVQISDLDPVETNRKRRADKPFAILHKGIATPWIRYGSVSLLLLILLSALFLQIYQPASTSSTNALSNETGASPPENGSNVSFGSDQVYIQAGDGTLTAYQAENGHILWRDKLPEQASLLASGQIMYVYYATTAGNGTLEALNGNNGRNLWRHSLSAPGTELALEQFGDALYVADDSNTIYAFQASNGHLRWTYRDSIRPILPVGNLLQVKSGIAEIFQADQGQSFLHASDGRQILHVHPDNSGNLPQVIIDGQLIYALPNIGDAPVPQPVQVFRVSDGKLLWSWALPYTSSEVSLMEQDGIIFYRDDTNPSLTALSSTEGHVLWTYKASNYNGIVYTNLEETGSVYLMLQDNTLIRLRASDGQLIWSAHTKTTDQQSSDHYSNPDPLFDDGTVFLFNTNDTGSQVYAVRASDGKILWRTATTGFSGSFSGMPIPLSGVIYAMQTNGQLDAWREIDGTLLWHYQVADSQEEIADLADNSNIVLLADQQVGNVEVLRASDGKLLWRYRA